MKNSIITSLLIASFQLNSQCQNLVPNPSFEDTIKCPQWISSGNCPGPFYDAFADCVPPWYLPTCGTSDYFNACSNVINGVSVPNNFRGYQLAATGDAYAGMYVYGNSGNPWEEQREYIATPLSQPLEAGANYFVEFYINLSNGWYCAIDSIGLYFSIGPIDTTGVNLWVLPFVPHISSMAGNFLNDTVNWTKISGTYVATGGEDYITIGNFSTNANTASDSANTRSYYFVDDVLVMKDTTSGIEEKRIRTIEIYPNPARDRFTIRGNYELPAALEMYNIIGERVKSEQITKLNAVIDVSHLSKGLYLWQLGTARGKVVIIR